MPRFVKLSVGQETVRELFSAIGGFTIAKAVSIYTGLDAGLVMNETILGFATALNAKIGEKVQQWITNEAEANYRILAQKLNITETKAQELLENHGRTLNHLTTLSGEKLDARGFAKKCDISEQEAEALLGLRKLHVWSVVEEGNVVGLLLSAGICFGAAHGLSFVPAALFSSLPTIIKDLTFATIGQGTARLFQNYGGSHLFWRQATAEEGSLLDQEKVAHLTLTDALDGPSA